MVVRYGAINDSDGELYTEEHESPRIEEHERSRSEEYESSLNGSILEVQKKIREILNAFQNISVNSFDTLCYYKTVLLGTFLSIISGLLFTANNFIINQFHIVVSDVVVVRCIIQIIVCTCSIYYTGDNILPDSTKKKILTVSQGLIGSISFIACLASVSFMPVPDAMCIIFTCPVVTIVLSAIMLGDKINSLKCFSGTLLILGVVLVCQPPFLFHQTAASQTNYSLLLSSHTDLYYVGVAVAATACCTGGLTNVLIAKCEGVSTWVLLNWAAISGLGIVIAFSQTEFGSHILSPDILCISWLDWIVLIGLAVSGILAFSSMVKPLKLISPNLVSSLRTLELVLAYVVQIIITGDNPDIWSCFGGGFILIGVLVLAFQDKISEMFSPSQRPQGPTLPEQYRYQSLDELSRLCE